MDSPFSLSKSLPKTDRPVLHRLILLPSPICTLIHSVPASYTYDRLRLEHGIFVYCGLAIFQIFDMYLVYWLTMDSYHLHAICVLLDLCNSLLIGFFQRRRPHQR